jgi:hypothetical protein
MRLVPTGTPSIVAELTEEQKLEIVTRLAQFEGPSEIMKDLGTRGIATDHAQIGSYDPTRPYFEAGEKWREIFDAARKAYLTDVAAVPIANQGYRLNELDKMFKKAVKQGNMKLAAELAEQASKEVGGVYSNVRELNLSDSRRPNPRDLTVEDRQQMLSELIRKAMEGMPSAPGVDPQHGSVQ